MKIFSLKHSKFVLMQICMCLAFFFAIERFCHKKTHGFRVHKIQPILFHDPSWEFPKLADTELQKIQHIFSQPFYFLNSGGESYAFVSKDNQYVLKFFKQHHMQPKRWEDMFLPKKFRTQYQQQRTKRLHDFFTSCKLAYDHFREDSGLIYLHIHNTDYLQTALKFFDAIGVVHTLSLDTIPFALQEKAAMAYPTLIALSEAKELQAAQKRLSSLVELMMRRCYAGLADHDARRRNFGFIGERAIELDLGSFSQDESLKTQEEMQKTLLHETIKLRQFVRKHTPELSNFLDEKIMHLSLNNNT